MNLGEMVDGITLNDEKSIFSYFTTTFTPSI